MTIYESITFYKNQRAEAKLGQQLFAIPSRDDMIDSQAFYYYVGDRRKVAVDFQREICFHMKHIHLKSMDPEQYVILQTSTTKMEDLIRAGLIHPFLLFVNGYMIPWQYITIIIDQEWYDILISGMPFPFFEKVQDGGDGYIEHYWTLELPDSIEYRQGGFPITNKTLFAFNEEGEFVHDAEEAFYTIENFEANVDITDFHNPESTTFLIAEDHQYKYFPENVFMFSNGRYLGDATCEILATGIRLFDGKIPYDYQKDLFVRVFHNTKKVTPSYDNIRKVSLENNKEEIFKALMGNEPSEYMKLLQHSFDPTMSTKEEIGLNYKEFLDYMAKYDHELFNMVYRSNKSFVELRVNGLWMLEHRDSDGYLKLPRRFQDGINFFIVVLVNGQLYPYYFNHFYKMGEFYCPVQDINEDDRVELWYFKNARTYTLPATISKDTPFINLDRWVYNDDMRIFCKDTADDYFSFPEDGNQHFPVPYHFETDPTNTKRIRVRFEDDFYYGKKCTLCSCRRFAYHCFRPKLEEDKIYFNTELGSAFDFCNLYDHYLVFFNGKRLMNDMYRLVLPNRTTTPFTKAMIYTCVPIRAGDQLEVFYLPNRMMDIYTNPEILRVPEGGLIEIDKDLLNFSLDKELCSVWVNNRKIPSECLKNISSNKIQILMDMTSSRDVRVTTMIGEEELEPEAQSRFKEFESYWDKAVELHGDPAQLMGYEPPTIEDTDDEAFPEKIPTVAVMNEIIRDWYVANAIVDTTKPFIYDYLDVDQSAIIGKDSGENDLLGAMDSSRTDNLNVVRPWP